MAIRFTKDKGAGSTSTGTGGGSGTQGIPGAKGDKGDKGDQGIQGVQGAQGLQGVPGIKGDKGDKGDTGDTGLTGQTGLTGATGAKGDKGDKGDQGVQGIPGIQGIPGVKGDTGNTGLKGDIGIQGAQGIQGVKGDKGDTGNPGVNGIDGARGPIGATGNDGAQGIQGVKGDKGDTGAQGPKGDTGASGSDYSLSLVSGRFYPLITAAPSVTAFGSQALTAGQVYSAPFFTPKSITINQICLNITAASAGNMRVGIYSGYSVGNASLVLDAGNTIDSGSTGLKTVNIAATTLTAGWYTFVVTATAAPTITAIPNQMASTSLLGQTAAGTAAPNMRCLLATSPAANALPNPITFTDSANVIPLFWVRAN